MLYPEPFLHLRAAIQRGHKPDVRDLGWLAQNPNYLETLNETERDFAQACLAPTPESLTATGSGLTSEA